MTKHETIRTHYDHLGKVMAQRERMKSKGIALKWKVGIGIEKTFTPPNWQYK